MSLDGAKILKQFLLGKKPLTMAAYTLDLEDFRLYLKAPTIRSAIERLFSHGHAKAQEILTGYRARMMATTGTGRDLAPATVNRRLSTLRSLGKQVRIMGLIPWVLEAKNEKVELVRSVRGPGRQAIEKIFRHLWSQRRTKPLLRDLAIFHLLYDLGLRRGEVVALNLSHLKDGQVAVKGKGKRISKPFKLPPEAWQDLQAWIVVRGPQPGALFINFDTIHRSKTGKRLSGSAVYAIVKARAKAAGVDPTLIRPHGIRHTAITEAVKQAVRTGLRIDEVAQFSRHADPRTMFKYVDQETDVQGELSAGIAVRRRESGKRPAVRGSRGTILST